MFIRHRKPGQSLNQCPREVLEWAADRIGISCEMLQAKLTDDELERLKDAYEASKKRLQEK